MKGPYHRHHWHVVPPFGLRRQIFWSLLCSAAAAGFAAFLISLLWHSLPMGTLLALFAVATLWMASGQLAWRLARPLNRLADVVQRYGQGDFSARAAFPACRQDEVSRVAHAIDEMAGRIERQMKEERQLLAAVSHEMRTPMARIRVLTDLARTGTKPEALDAIDREVEEIDTLVANLLARSRLEFHSTARQPVRLPEAAAEALTRAGLDAAALLHVQGERAYETVSADPTLLHRAIANLIDNAQRHGNGVTAVEVREGEHGVILEILDDGPGFAAGTATDRFQAFASSTLGRANGLGIGMSLVRRIIQEAHGGRVWAQNRPQPSAGAQVGFEVPFT